MQRLALAGATGEPSLIDSLLAEAGDEPGNLTLLEHALSMLWKSRVAGRDLAKRFSAYNGIRARMLPD